MFKKTIVIIGLREGVRDNVIFQKENVSFLCGLLNIWIVLLNHVFKLVLVGFCNFCASIFFTLGLRLSCSFKEDVYKSMIDNDYRLWHALCFISTVVHRWCFHFEAH